MFGKFSKFNMSSEAGLVFVSPAAVEWVGVGTSAPLSFLEHHFAAFLLFPPWIL